MPCTFQLEIDNLSPQARDIYHQTLRNLHDYGPPPDDHHCFGAREHHTRYNFEDAERFQAYTKALDLQFEEPDPQGATRGTVRSAPEVDTVQGHYGIYRVVDQVHNARIAQACHPGLREMEFIEIDISDELYFGDILAVKTLAFNPGYFPRPSGSSVLPYHRTTATLPGDHCRWSAKEYLVFRRHIRRSQALLRIDERVGVIEGFSGLTRLPSSFHVGRVYLGDVFYPEHLEIRGLTPILTHLPTILRHWKSRCAVPESLRALADSADLQNTRFDHRMFQHRVKICRDDELTVNCSADWLEGSRVLVGFLDREIEAVLVKSCNGYLTFQLSARYTGPPWVPVMVQQLGFQGEPLGNRERSRRSSRGSEEYRGDCGERGDRVDRGDRGDLGDRGDRGRSRSPSEERYPQPLVGVYDPEPNRGSPDFEERYGRDEGRRSPREQWDGPPSQDPRNSCQGYRPSSPESNRNRQDQWDGPPGQDPRDSRQGYRPSSPEQRNWSPGPRLWDRNDPQGQWNDSPRDYQPRDNFGQPQESWDSQFRRPESEQYQNDPQQPSEYRNQDQQFSEPQFSPQSPQFYRSQPGDRPYESQYPSSQSGYPQEHRQPQFNPQGAQYYRSQPGDRPYESQYPSNQPGHLQYPSDCPGRPSPQFSPQSSSDQRSLTQEQLNLKFSFQNYQNFQREKRQSYRNEDQYPSEYRSQPQDHFEPQFSHQGAQSYRNQGEGRPGNASGYPSDRSGHPQERFESRSSSQNHPFNRDSPEDRQDYVNIPQYSSEHRSQPRFTSQSDQFYRSQPGDRPNASQYPSSSQYPSDYRGQPQAPSNPQFSPPNPQQSHSSHSDYPVIPTEQPNPRQDAQGDQSPQGYRNQSHDRPDNASQYPLGHQDHRGQSQDHFKPQFSPQGAQCYRNQFDGHRSYANDGQYPSEYRSQPQDAQFSPHGAQSNRSQPDNDPRCPSTQPGHPQDRFETPILSQNRPQYRNQPGDRPFYPNDPQYPPEHPSQPQNCFKPQFSSQSGQSDRNQFYNRPANPSQYPLGQPGPYNPQFGPQHYRNQSEDRQTLPRSLSPRVSTLSPSGDPIICHSQSRSSVSQASSVSGDHFQGEQPSQRPGAPRASGPSRCTSGHGYASPAGYPVRNPLSYHSDQPQDHQPSPNQVPSTSRAAGYSDGLSPTGQSYYQGYATSSDGSEEDDSSSESEPEILQKTQKQGYNALYSHFPSSSGREATDSYSPRVPSQVDDLPGDGQGAPSPSTPRAPGQPVSTFVPEPEEPVEPAEPPKPVRAQTPPFDPHNSRSWRHEHKDDICEVMEPVSQDQGSSRTIPSQPVQSPRDPETSYRSSGDLRGSGGSQGPRQSVREHSDPQTGSQATQHSSHLVEDHRGLEPSQNKSGSQSTAHHRTSQASSYPSQPVVEFPEPSKPGSRSSVDYRTSQTSQRPSHPVQDHRDPQTSTRSSTDHRGSQASQHPAKNSWPVQDHPDSKSSRSSLDRKASTASHYSADPKWPSEPENSAPEEDQHPEHHIYNATIPETSSSAPDTVQDHPYLPALLKHQVLVVDALDVELHIASAAATLAKTDWNLKARGLKQRGTQVIVCKPSEAPRITGMLLDALEGSGVSGLRLIRFTGETLLQIDFDRCLARKLRGILREPGAWDQRIVLQAARHLTRDPLTPKLENLLRNNSHIPEMSMEEWVSWYMERWVPDVLLSTSEYLEVGTKYLRRVESVQVLGEVSEGHGELTARFPKAKIAVIGDVLGPATVPRHPETVEILKEAFSGLRGSRLISLRVEAPGAPQIQNNYLKIRSGIFPNPNFPILLIHNTSTKGTKEERNLQERKALDELVKGLLGLETGQIIPAEDLQIICIEKNQVRDLRAISTPGIRIRSRQEASEGVQGVYTRPEEAPGPRSSQEDDSATQDHPQTTPIAIICCSNYKKTAFELIRAQLPQLLSYGTQATIFIGNIDEMEVAEGWGALLTRCEEVGCSYSYQMVPEERSRRYQPTKRDHKGFMGPLPEYGSSRGSSSEFGGFESPKSRSSGSGSPRSVTSGSSVSPRSEPEQSKPEIEVCEPKSEESELSELKSEKSEPSKPEPFESKSEESELLDPEHKVADPKFEKSELSEPKSEEPETSEPKPEEPEPLEPELEACEPEIEESELFEPKPEPPGLEAQEPEPSGPEPKASEPKLEESEQFDPKPEESEPFEPEHKVSEPKLEKAELSEPKSEEPEPSEPKPEETEPSETDPVTSESSEPKPELSERSHEKPEPLDPEHNASEPKSGEPEPHKLEFEACEPKSEEPEQSEPEHKACEPKFEESEPSESKPEEPELFVLKSEKHVQSELEPKACEPKSGDSEPRPEESESSEPALDACEPNPERTKPSEPKPEPPGPKAQEPELSGPEPEACEQKSDESEPSGPEPEACEPNSEEPEPLETEQEACEPKCEESVSSEPGPEACEPNTKESETTNPKLELPEPKTPILPQNPPKSSTYESNMTLEHLDLAITATVSPTLSPAIPRKSCSLPPEKDFTTPDCLLENLTLEDLEPSDQEYEDCEEEFEDAREAENQDSDTGTYESTYSEHKETTGPEELECLEKLEEKQ